MSNPPLSQIEARLFRALEKDPRTADANKNALVGCLRAFRQSRADSDYAIAGDLALRVKGIGVGLAPVELEIAVASWASVPVAELKAEGFEMRLDRCSMAGSTVRFREVRPAALARAERFGLLPVLGAADSLKGKLDDACADWTPAESRVGLIAELDGLLVRFPDSFDNVENARGRLVLARRKSETETKAEAKKEIPMTTNPTSLDKAVAVAKALFTLFSAFVLFASCNGGAGATSGFEVDGGTKGWISITDGGYIVGTVAGPCSTSGCPAGTACGQDQAGTCGNLCGGPVPTLDTTLTCAGGLGTCQGVIAGSTMVGICCPGCVTLTQCSSDPASIKTCAKCWAPKAACAEPNALTPTICVAAKQKCLAASCSQVDVSQRMGAPCSPDGVFVGKCGGTNNETCQ